MKCPKCGTRIDIKGHVRGTKAFGAKGEPPQCDEAVHDRIKFSPGRAVDGLTAAAPDGGRAAQKADV